MLLFGKCFDQRVYNHTHGDLSLGFGGHVSKHHRSRCQFTLSHDEHPTDTRAIGLLHLGLQALVPIFHGGADAFEPQGSRPFKGEFLGRITQGGDIQVRRSNGRRGVHRDDFRQAVETDGKADGRDLRPAQGADQSIVAPTARYGTLGAQRAGLDLEGGAGVVIQPAHQLFVHLEGNAQLGQRYR